ncbi:MAG TPA: galactose oxidase-like domain-containing protein, partial [Candidatus Eremiobacteraceae bacterium]|nr:galactose oxidase-like domain-containing protein [Candidatus Eremiobacteraceae bacterium]
SPSMMPIDPVHGILLNSGSVFYLAGSGNCPPGQAGCPTDFGSATIWNPTTGGFTTFPLPYFDMFCNGATQMADGKIFINGGTATYATGPAAAIMRAMHHGNSVPGGPVTSAVENTPGHRVPRDATTVNDQGFGGSPLSAIYDPATSKFTLLPAMAAGRWYPTTTLMGNGNVFVYGGQDENANDNALIEIWQSATSAWQQVVPTCSIGGGPVGDCRTLHYSDNSLPVPGAPALYPRMMLLPDGRIIHAGPEPETWIFDPNAPATSPNWSYVNSTLDTEYRSYGSVVLLPLLPQTNYQPVLMTMGGMGTTVAATNTTELMDMSQANPMWVAGPAMSQPRVEMNAVLLPTGKVLAIGGSADDENPSTASTNADLYDPLTNSFTALNPNTYAHLYHSTGVLLPDASVVLSGGNPQQGSFQTAIEIYQPPYFFNADGSLATRPSLTATPASITYGQTFSATTNGNIASVVLIRQSAATHAFDMSQRLIGLNFAVNGTTMGIAAPPNSNIAPPGPYLLFVVNSNGVPSVGQPVMLAAQ